MTDDGYRAVFRASPDAILLVDVAGIIREANSSAERMFGYPHAELIGREVEMLVPAAARRGHVAHRRSYAEHPTVRPMGIGMELTAVRRDGTEFPVEIALSPWASGHEQLTIAAVRDVSQRAQLRRFGAAALEASEAERKRIARELHDDTAQRLSALLLRLRMLERDAPEVAGLLEGFREEISTSIEVVRRIARGLRPPEIEDAGIVAALRAHARRMRDANGFQIEIEADPVDGLLDPSGRLVLYRVVQEALGNASRHSGATSAHVSVRRVDSNVVTSVTDQGRGFAVHGANGPDEGLGLLGMQERAAAAGGRVRIESEPGRGTRVTLTLPVSPAPTESGPAGP
jgi:PAS domain S-box-containing protein